MIKHADYWLEDGSVLITVEDTVYRLYRSLITRLSPGFFDDCCRTTTVPKDISSCTGSDSLPCFTLRSDVQVSKDDFEALIAHILHDVSVIDNPPFVHLLRLYTISSAARGNFKKIHRESERQLGAYMERNPLDIDFGDYDLLKNAFQVANEDDNVQLKSLLKRALYYSYTTHGDISFDEGNALESREDENQLVLSSESESETNARHITGSDAILCERLMSQLSEHFSPTLFQPPAALHMECTDVYASLWMERAVQPAFSDNGTANPFFTLQRLRTLDWGRETDGLNGERSQPCSDCLEHMRREWRNEAQAIWEMMDEWLVE